MQKAKNRTVATVIVMLVIALAIISFYFYWLYRIKPQDGSSMENMTEVEKLLSKDLELNYPETPREVVKLFGNMMKVLYDELKDDDTEALAMKIRELYDEEFLANNPQETYLNNLYTDIASWKENDRRIANYLLVNKELEQEEVIDGVEYAIIYIAYTIQENGKFTETWKVLLRQDANKKWKILGWQIVPKET